MPKAHTPAKPKTTFAYAGKRFLITNPILRDHTGSIMVTLELAHFLQSMGAEVTIYTSFYNYPVKKAFEQYQLHVVTGDEYPEFSLQDFDYIWIHGQILPDSIIREFDHLSKAQTKFIFLHMSPHFDLVPDEFPWIYQLEAKLANLRLVISEEVEEVQNQYLEFSPTLFFRNPAPLEFCQVRPQLHTQLENLLVVTNHPPVELEAALDLLRAEHPQLKIHTLGETLSETRPITADDLAAYDAIVTIGKTVQYGLVAGIPVFIYDRFGGIGYLSAQNYTSARAKNFSGRNGKTLTARAIADRLIADYPAARKFAEQQRPESIHEYSIKNVLDDILNRVPQTHHNNFSSSYIKSILAAEQIAYEFFRALGLSKDFYERANSDLDSLQQALARQQQQITTLQATIDQDTALKRELQQLKSSRSYRLVRQLQRLSASLRHPFHR